MTTYRIHSPVPSEVRKVVRTLGQRQVILARDLKPGHIGEMLAYGSQWTLHSYYYAQLRVNVEVDGVRLPWSRTTDLHPEVLELGSVHFYVSNDRVWMVRHVRDNEAPLIEVTADELAMMRLVPAHRQWKREFIECYEVGCAHRIKERTIANCLHEYTCRDCGHRWQVDSSG